MTIGVLLGVINLFGAGMLAGEEFVIRYGVRGPLGRLRDEPHIRLRQELIRTLRVLVPAIYLPTLLLTIAETALNGVDQGLAFRCAAVLALVVWIAITLGGTAPINAAALEWHPDAPPEDWRVQVDRWERLNSVRAWLAITAFVLLLAGTAASAARW